MTVTKATPLDASHEHTHRLAEDAGWSATGPRAFAHAHGGATTNHTHDAHFHTGWKGRFMVHTLEIRTEAPTQ